MTAWTVDDIPDLTGRTAVVTGANSGIGFESALALAGAGAEVVLACRDQTKGTDALDRIRRALPAAPWSSSRSTWPICPRWRSSPPASVPGTSASTSW